MKRSILIFFQITLLLMICVPVAWAGSAISMSLDKTKASGGDVVTATGITLPNSWVPIKVLDEAKNIVLFDTGKSDDKGYFSIDFKVPNNAFGVLTVVVGEGSNVTTGTLNGPQEPNDGQPDTGDKTPNPGNSPGVGGGPSPDKPVVSTTGKANVKPGAGGTVSLGSEATIDIPANALKATEKVEVKVEKVRDIPEVPADFRLVGKVYEFSVGGQSSYNFAKEVTITLSFDPSLLQPGETPAIYYYDENEKQWVKLGGTISGNSISVKVSHFTKFAVMAELEAVPVITDKYKLIDITGHWAENNIKELVAIGVISGYPDGSFKPDNNITRAEFASILVKAFELKSQSGKVFADTVGHWAQDAIATAAHYGIVSGYDTNTFGPDDTITREQMAVMIVNATNLTPAQVELPFIDSNSISAWAREAMATAVNNGIINGYPDNTVRPQGNASRAEAVTVIMNVL